MYAHWIVNLVVVLATAITVALTVHIHYEGLRWMSMRLGRKPAPKRGKVLMGAYGVILLHVVEIWLFGVTYTLLLRLPGAGHVSGSVDGFLDDIYLSAVTFSTVGFGDVAPVGAIRFLAGTESLVGFILITWSASFLYLEMQQFWSAKRGQSPF